MDDTSQAAGGEGEPGPAMERSAEEPALAQRVMGASAWTFGSIGGMVLMRAVSQIVLAALLFPEFWGIIAKLRVFLVAVEMLSEVGIRSSVVYHRKGTTPTFLNTAWTLQIGRGVVMWLACCALAWPGAWWFEQPLLLWLLPVAGLESVNNGLLSVGIFTRQRKLRLGLPIVLEWIGLAVSIVTSIVWAVIDKSVWALAMGPLVGGAVKTTLSHVLVSEVRLRLQWDRDAARALIDFGKWVYAGTAASFVAQQFLILYVGRFVMEGILGVYQIAWGLALQSSKPLTMLNNQVLIPLFAESGRSSPEEHRRRVQQAMYRYLPASLLITVCFGLGCPAFFGIFYRDDYVGAGLMGRFIAVVIWFMVLQHVPRAAMLSLGHSKGVCAMMSANGVVTIGGCIAGYMYGDAIGVGAMKGAILGNALGNVAGCVVGTVMTRRLGIAVGMPILKYSLAFTGLFLVGILVDELLQFASPWIDSTVSSVLATLILGVPLGLLVWRRTLRTAGRGRGEADARTVA